MRFVIVLGVLAIAPWCVAGAQTLATEPPGTCCKLQGDWRLLLIMDSTDLPGVPVDGREVRGRIQFSEEDLAPRVASTPPLTAEDSAKAALRLQDARFDMDFSAFWPGGSLAPVPSTTLLGKHPDPLHHAIGAVGVVADSIKVVVVLNPYFTHGGVAMRGSFESDSVIMGTWKINGPTVTGGTFRMSRASKR